MNNEINPDFFKQIARLYAKKEKLNSQETTLIENFASFIDKALNETEEVQKDEKN